MKAKNGQQLEVDFAKPVSSKDVAPLAFVRMAPAKPTIVFDTYWKFAAERQSIFFKRLNGEKAPWTYDKILATYKFTNAYRASDRVSQFLIKNVIYRDDLLNDVKEVFFRIMIFKIFNKIETWELLERNFSVISLSEYSFKRYDRVLSRAMREGIAIYSNAYIMPSATVFGSPKKHRNHLLLLEQMLKDNLPCQISDSRTMQRSFSLMRSYPSIGDFLAYQFVTDINYSNIVDHSEMEFVVPGPGALGGIKKCFSDLGGLNDAEIIRLVADTQEEQFEKAGVQFKTIWGRRLQLIDCQNLFCEVDKYSRVKHPEFKDHSGRSRIKQKHKANSDELAVWYPPKWGINDKIGKEPY